MSEAPAWHVEFNLRPREVDLALEHHPAVAEVAVVVVRTSVGGDVLIEFTREHLAHYKCPHTVPFVDALPRNAMGKVMRGELSKRVSATG